MRVIYAINTTQKICYISKGHSLISQSYTNAQKLRVNRYINKHEKLNSNTNVKSVHVW